jgi:hypothetical protein
MGGGVGGGRGGNECVTGMNAYEARAELCCAGFSDGLDVQGLYV